MEKLKMTDTGKNTPQSSVCDCNFPRGTWVREDAGESLIPGQKANVGLCNTCQARVPAAFFERGGRLYIRKDCPDCGRTESEVSSDASVWLEKRRIWDYVPSERVACTLHCDKCGVAHHPTIVFVDVTNRCNMNCPICIANVRGMGFEFHPPLEYFEKLFEVVGRFEPTPMVELFGGEPTVREDLLDVIAVARRHGLKPRVVTNGLRLADEDYCRKLCEAKVRFRFAFDGRSEEVYRRLRSNPAAYHKKVRALKNLRKHSRRNQAIISCIARGVNDQHVADLIQMCHDDRHMITELGVIPLTENWEEGEFETGIRTTMEDVEKIVADSVPGGEVEFVPAGLVHTLRQARRFFRTKSSRSELLMLGGVHPNCESMTVVVSDGEKYVSANKFLKVKLSDLAAECLARGRRIEKKLDALDPHKPLQRLRGLALILRTYGPMVRRAVDLRRFTRGNPTLVGLKILFGLMIGRKFRDLCHKHLIAQQVLRMAVLPFEEYHSIDGARLENCKAVFAYEDADSGKVQTIPACTWYLYRNPILKRLSEKYGVKGRAPKPEAEPAEAAATMG
jgi:hypothetical protein